MKRRTLYRLWLCLLLGIVTGHFADVTEPLAVSAQGDPISEIIQRVNQVRASYGLPGYTPNAILAIAAQNHANWMAATAIYSHTGAGGSSPQSRAIAAGYSGYVSENIVGGTLLTPQQGVTWWLNSPVHFNTVISPRHTQIGVGYAVGNDQNFYVMVVGNPNDGPPEAARTAADEALKAEVPFVVAPITLSTPREDGSIVHTVLPGHTFWAIAARYGVSLSDLFLFNSLTEDDTLQPGDELIIRLAEGQAPPPTPTPPARHVVRRGETAWTIAATYKVSLADILWLNNLQEDSILQPGDEIRLRLLEGEVPPPTPTPQISHIVRSGDTAWTIALLYNLTLDQLLAYNNLSANTLLQVGQELLIISPTPLPTPTSEATPTLLPTTAVIATTPPTMIPSPSITPTTLPTPSATVVPANGDRRLGQSIFMGTMGLGLGLMVLGGMVIRLLKKEPESSR